MTLGEAKGIAPMKKILFICVQSPFPPWSGGALRSWGWIRTASQVACVGLVTMTRTPEEEQAVQASRSSLPFVETLYVPRTRKRKIWNLLQALASHRPYLVQSSLEAGFLKKVKEAIGVFNPDLVQAEWVGATPYLQAAREHNLPAMYGAHNIEYQVIEKAGGNGRRLSVTARKLRETEIDIARKASAVIALSRSEETWFRTLGCRVFYVPNAVTLADYAYHPPPANPKNPTVLFIGHLGYPPNRDAVRILVKQILPLIRKQLPQVECLIAGRSAGSDIMALQGPGITVISDRPDLGEVWRRGQVLLVPLRWGAGSRLKLLEAAAYGVPIVATPFAADGLSLQPEMDFFSGVTPEELAQGCLSVLAHPEEAARLSWQARKRVESEHSWEHYRETIRQIYEDIIDNHRKK
jgi:glycosyltransferase involved in cell wall biosynthesis